MTGHHAEPYATCAEVPPADTGTFDCIGGVPINFQPTDKLVALAAKRGMTLLPVVFDAPSWAAKTVTPGDFPLPASDDLYANFMTALVRRYGPHGSFWAANPRLRPVPIRMWQIWNEPSLELYWPIQPFADSYVALVHAAHDAIKQIDPGAKIVLAGMPNFVWDYVSQIYDVSGSKQFFDVVAVHPFTAEPAGVITILQRVRDVMDRAGDGSKPILATEVSFPSAQGKSSQHFGFETTEAGQASKLSQLLPMLAANRNKLHLLGFYHYTWLSRDIRGGKSFSFSGSVPVPRPQLQDRDQARLCGLPAGCAGDGGMPREGDGRDALCETLTADLDRRRRASRRPCTGRERARVGRRRAAR